MSDTVKFDTNAELYSADNLAKMIYEKAEATKKVSKLAVTLSECKDIADLVVAVNSLTDQDTMFYGYPIEQVRIPKFVSGWIYPAKVALGVGHRFIDLVERPVSPSSYKYDPRKIADVSAKIYGSFKSESVLEAIPGRDKVATLSDAYTWVVDGRLFTDKMEGLTFPVPLVGSLSPVLGEFWANENLTRYMELYWTYDFKICP